MPVLWQESKEERSSNANAEDARTKPNIRFLVTKGINAESSVVLASFSKIICCKSSKILFVQSGPRLGSFQKKWIFWKKKKKETVKVCSCSKCQD